MRGRLTSAEKDLFERNYLASTLHRDRVAFARTLVEAADSTAERGEAHRGGAQTGAEAASSWWSSFLVSLSGNSWRWATVAAMLLFAVASFGLLSERARLRDQLAQTQAERAVLGQRKQELERQLAQQRSSDAETENELARVRNRLAQLEQQLAAGGQHPEQRDLRIIAFNLAPQTRGIGQIPTLSVPAGTDYVALTLELETDAFPAFRAALKNPATGQIVWRSGNLKAGEKSRTVRVRLPASSLNAQKYAVELSGVSASGVVEPVSSYLFRLEGRR